MTQLAKAVHVTHPAPAYCAEYERVYGAPVTFEAGWNAILLDENWLNHKISVQPRYVFGILSEHADTLLKSLEDSKSTRGHVESLLMPVLHKGKASVDTIAGKMGLSPPDAVPPAQGGRHDIREGAGRIAPPACAAISAWQEGIGERNRLSRRIFRARGILARVQAMDGRDPARREAGRRPWQSASRGLASRG